MASDASAQSWFVKASFGMEWGPMSLETMREMADHGELANGDLARFGMDGEWQSVLSVLDQSPTSNAIANSVEPVLSAPPAEGSRPVLSKLGKSRPGALPNWSSYWGTESATSETPVVMPRFVLNEEPSQIEPMSSVACSSLEESVPNSGCVSPIESPMDTAVPSGEFTELEAWKRERAERLERLMKIVRDREVVLAETAHSETKPEANSAETVVDVDTTDPSLVEDNPSTLPSKRASPSAATPKTRRSARSTESWSETLDRWQRSLPDARAALVLLILPLGVWWFWPSSDAAIVATYRSMYLELLELREHPNDKSGMDEFLARSQLELDRVIPGLEKRASPNQPAVQWLLWMGRDCLRPMFKQPRRAETKPELTFNKLMREWQRANEPNFESVNSSAPEIPTATATDRPVEITPAVVNESNGADR